MLKEHNFKLRFLCSMKLLGKSEGQKKKSEGKITDIFKQKNDSEWSFRGVEQGGIQVRPPLFLLQNSLRLFFLDFYFTVKMKTVWYWHRNRNID